MTQKTEVFVGKRIKELRTLQKLSFKNAVEKMWFVCQYNQLD